MSLRECIVIRGSYWLASGERVLLQEGLDVEQVLLVAGFMIFLRTGKKLTEVSDAIEKDILGRKAMISDVHGLRKQFHYALREWCAVNGSERSEYSEVKGFNCTLVEVADIVECICDWVHEKGSGMERYFSANDFYPQKYIKKEIKLMAKQMKKKGTVDNLIFAIIVEALSNKIDFK